jgi:hypothetical protein
MSLRQRDQSEKNLSNEVQKMQQDIQASEYKNILSFINLLSKEYKVGSAKIVREIVLGSLVLARVR